MLYTTLNIKQPNYKAFMRSDLAAGRFMLLGRCLESCEPAVKAEIKTELLDQLEAIVLNDRK